MLPHAELDTLLSAVTDAAGLARAGRLADGYTCLLTGLRRARLASDLGAAWGEQLASHYAYALDRYQREWGVALEEATTGSRAPGE